MPCKCLQKTPLSMEPCIKLLGEGYIYIFFIKYYSKSKQNKNKKSKNKRFTIIFMLCLYINVWEYLIYFLRSESSTIFFTEVFYQMQSQNLNKLI